MFQTSFAYEDREQQPVKAEDHPNTSTELGQRNSPGREECAKEELRESAESRTSQNLE